MCNQKEYPATLINLLKRLLFIFLAVFSLASCQPMPKNWHWGAKPRPLTGIKGFPSADTDYGKGFRDGCTNSWNIVGRGWVSTLPSKLDPALLTSNPDYATGWSDGSEQCVYIIDWDVF